MNVRLALALLALLLGACTSAHRKTGTRSVYSFDALEVVYDVAGEGSPTLVFVHGWCGNRRQWEAQVASFRERHRVVTVDLGGHGESDVLRSDWDVPSLARDLSAVLLDLEVRDAVLVGHSMGGPVALHTAARLPRRVRAVIGVDTLHDVSRPAPAEVVEPLLAGLEADYEGRMRAMIRGAVNADTPPEVVERIATDAVRTDKRIALLLLESMTGLDTGAALAACGVPVHCINCGETDADAGRAANPSFRVVRLEGSGHWPMLEAPAAFNALLAEQLARIGAEED